MCTRSEGGGYRARMETEQSTAEAQLQTKLLKSLLFRADLVLLLMLIGFVASLSGVFR